jgi:uncharacterized protein (TIGR03000 family)
MYSVVLMMAMTSGTDVPVDGLFNHGGSCSGSCYGGCYGGGYGGCYGGGYGGCYGGGYGGCHGGYAGSCHGGGYGSSCHGGGHLLLGGGGLFGGHHSCHGGSSCCGGGYGGCYGGGYGGCYGGGYGGCYGGGYGGCCGGGYVIPMQEEKKEEKKDDKNDKKEIGAVTAPAPATIVVTLPTDAKLLIDGAATKSTSSERTFVSPELMPGSVYHYTLKAEFMKEGQAVSVTKTIEVRAGLETRVTIEMSEAVATR